MVSVLPGVAGGGGVVSWGEKAVTGVGSAAAKGAGPWVVSAGVSLVIKVSEEASTGSTVALVGISVASGFGPAVDIEIGSAAGTGVPSKAGGGASGNVSSFTSGAGGTAGFSSTCTVSNLGGRVVWSALWEAKVSVPAAAESNEKGGSGVKDCGSGDGFGRGSVVSSGAVTA